MNRNLKLAVIFLIVVVATFGVALAVTHWSQSISWTMDNESFTVSGASTSVDLGVITAGSQHTETYTVTNDGNVAVTVAVSTAGSGFTASWNSTGATIPIGDSEGFELTLTVNAAGSCTVNIDKV